MKSSPERQLLSSVTTLCPCHRRSYLRVIFAQPAVNAASIFYSTFTPRGFYENPFLWLRPPP